MAVAFVQRIVASTDNDNLSATFTKNPSANTTQNNFVVACFANEDGTPVSVADNAGNTYTNVVTRALNGACAQIIAWAKLTTALTTSSVLTFTKAASGNRPSLVAMWEFSGFDDSAFDVGTSNVGTGTSMAAGPTATTTVADELVVATWAMDTDVSFTLDAAYTTLGATIGPAAGGSSGGNGHVLEAGYRIVSATGAQTATSSRGAGAVAWTATISTYKQAAGGGGGTTYPGWVSNAGGWF